MREREKKRAGSIERARERTSQMDFWDFLATLETYVFHFHSSRTVTCVSLTQWNKFLRRHFDRSQVLIVKVFFAIFMLNFATKHFLTTSKAKGFEFRPPEASHNRNQWGPPPLGRKVSSRNLLQCEAKNLIKNLAVVFFCSSYHLLNPNQCHPLINAFIQFKASIFF